MPERTDSHGNSPEPVDKLLHPEASDKKAETVKSSDSTAVAALQNEVIRLRRQEKRTASETDSINGRVEDYSSLLASITPKSEVPKIGRAHV